MRDVDRMLAPFASEEKLALNGGNWRESGTILFAKDARYIVPIREGVV